MNKTVIKTTCMNKTVIYIGVCMLGSKKHKFYLKVFYHWVLKKENWLPKFGLASTEFSLDKMLILESSLALFEASVAVIILEFFTTLSREKELFGLVKNTR